MRNRDRWYPSKYVFRRGRLMASRDPAEVAVGSRLMADILAGLYAGGIAAHAKGRLLDLGCGKAPLFAAYRDHVSDSVCVDWASTLHKNEYLDLEWDLNEALPFKSECFDTVLVSDVLEHLPSPENLWSEIARLLRRNGTVLMNVPFYYWLHEQPYDYYRYTEFALRRFVQRANLDLVELLAIGGAPEVMVDIFAKNVARLPFVGKPIAAFTQSAIRLIVQSGPGRRFSEATRDQFPFGYFLVARKPGVGEDRADNSQPTRGCGYSPLNQMNRA